MANESLATPDQMKCDHRWKKVDGATSPGGGLVVMCEKCNATKELTPPAQESKKDERPLLME